MTIEVDISAIRLDRPRHRPVTLVENVAFTIPKGATLGIVGESGSGKSLMALAIIGLLPGGDQGRRTGRSRWRRSDAAQRTATPACARREDRHDLPGADDGAQSRDARRRPDRRGLLRHKPIGGAEARAEALRLLERVRIPDARGASTPIRTNYPAVSASGSASPSLWRLARAFSSPTSRPPRSTSPCRPRCSICSAN